MRVVRDEQKRYISCLSLLLILHLRPTRKRGEFYKKNYMNLNLDGDFFVLIVSTLEIKYWHLQVRFISHDLKLLKNVLSDVDWNLNL